MDDEELAAIRERFARPTAGVDRDREVVLALLAEVDRLTNELELVKRYGKTSDELADEAEKGYDIRLREANGTIRYGTVTRRDGLVVRYREDSTQTDPDLALRFDTYPAKCGCYPLNTDEREWECEHGARWTRGPIEPYGLPIEPEENDA